MLEQLRAPRMRGERAMAYANRLVAADLWELAPLVGMRTSEIRLMERAWVDLGAAPHVLLPARATKRRRAREMPLNADAAAVLRRRLAAGGHARFVFPNAAGTNALSDNALYRSLAAAARRAELSYGQHSAGGFRLYDCRHTAATRMLQSEADMGSVADVLGNSKKVMLEVYSHSSASSRRGAVDKLRGFHTEDDKKSSRPAG